MPSNVNEQETFAKQEKLYEQYRRKTTRMDQKEVRKLNRPFTIAGKIFSVLFITLCIFAIWRLTARSEQLYFLGGLMFVYLLITEFFALLYRPCKKELTKDYKVSVIITCFNENPSSVVTIFENILMFDYPVHEILFLDDGSKDTLAYEVAKSFAEEHENLPNVPKFQIMRFEENRGKRAVMIDGFKMADGDYVFLLDSDSEIFPNALTELLRPFEDDKTTSCVGNIGILNKRENFLTRLQSITYYNAFQFGRAAQSVTGNVIVCSGAFSIHKKDFIVSNLEEFKKDLYCGVKVSAGDDRALTTIAKINGGKTRYQSTAYCETEAPNTWRKFISQRRRWQRSAYVQSLKSIKDMFPKKLLYIFWVFAEAYFWLVATIIFIISAIVTGLCLDAVDIILYFVIIKYNMSVFYLLYQPIRFLFIPIYLFVYGMSLIYTRIYAAVTLKDDSWGTRVSKDKKKSKRLQAQQ